jgi:streptogramin lyase
MVMHLVHKAAMGCGCRGREEGFSMRVLATNFSAPHNILYGPDGALWITDRARWKEHHTR